MTNRRQFPRRAVALLLVLGFAAVVWTYSIDTAHHYLLRERWETLFTLQQRELGNSNENRIEIAAQAISVGIKHPFFGIGVGCARYHLLASGRYYVNHAENVYLQLFLEQGLFGLATYLFLLVLTYRHLRQRILMAQTPLLDSMLAAVFVGLGVYGLFNSFADNTWYWTVLALVVAQAHLAPASLALSHRSRGSERAVPVYSPSISGRLRRQQERRKNDLS